ncbi:hypothetical protein AB6C47_018210 [Vibrio cyclitrophicus]
MNKQFNSDVISKSQYILSQNPKIEQNLTKSVKKFKNDEPMEFGNKLLNFFYKQNKIRPEILLDANSELSNKIFNSPEQHQAFCDVVTDYQRQEQVSIKACLEANRDTIEGVNLNRLGMALDPSFRNMRIYNGKRYIELETEEPEQFVSEFALTAITLKDYDAQKQIEVINQMAEQNKADQEVKFVEGFVVGEEEPLMDLPEQSAEQEEIDQKIKHGRELSEQEEQLIEQEQKNTEKLMVLNKQKQEEHVTEFLKGYTTDKKEQSYFNEDGALRFKFKRSMVSKAVTQAIAGPGSSSEELVGMLTAVKVKKIHSIPDQDLPAFKEALEKIKEEGLFDLDEIKLGRGLNPQVKEILEQVKGNSLKIGDMPEQKPDQNKIDNGNDNDNLKNENKNIESQENDLENELTEDIDNNRKNPKSTPKKQVPKNKIN